MKQSTKNIKNNYYNWDKAFSFNALFNLIITARGFGKTYGIIIKMIKQFYHKGKKTIFLTKYKTELDGKDGYQKSVYDTITNDINENIQDIKDLHLDFELNGNHILIDGKIAFSFYAISQAEKIKKITLLKTYDFIIHDEAITLGRYVKNEIDLLMTIYDTMNRRKTIEASVKMFLLGNALTKYNPYFEYFGLKNMQNGYNFIKQRRWLVHIDNNPHYAHERQSSAISLLAEHDANYLKMANQNNFVYDDADFIAENIKDFEKTYFMLSLENGNYTFSRFANGYILHQRHKASLLYHYKTPTPTSAPLRKDRVDKLRTIFNYSQLYFQNIQIKNDFEREFIR